MTLTESTNPIKSRYKKGDIIYISTLFDNEEILQENVNSKMFLVKKQCR